MKAVKSDKIVSLAVEQRYSQLPPQQRMVIDECASVLKDEVRGMGQMTAREVLYQVGRLLATGGNTGHVPGRRHHRS